MGPVERVADLPLAAPQEREDAAAAARLGLNLRQMRYRMSRLAIVAPTSGPGDHEPS